MARYSKQSRLEPIEILRRAEDFFGAGGLGLKVVDRLLEQQFDMLVFYGVQLSPEVPCGDNRFLEIQYSCCLIIDVVEADERNQLRMFKEKIS